MPLPVFEAYFTRGEDNGYPQEHWEAVVEEYEKLIDEKNAGSTREIIGRHTSLAWKYNFTSKVLDMCEALYTGKIIPGRVAYAPKMAEYLAATFKPYTFSRETIADDIEKGRSKLKALRKQVEETGDLLPGDENSLNSSFFSDVLRAYGQVFQYAPPRKQDLTVLDFAGYYKDLQRRIENDNKRTDDE